MDKDLKAKWVAALRSGKYKKASGRLKCDYSEYGREDYHYCCLGVLREIAPEVEGNEEDVFLEPDTCGIDFSTQQRLARMNDGCKGKPFSFSQIADYIEENL